ncbi:unnamed protein product [Victoria cruziana]
MDHHRPSSNNIDDNVGIPEDLRCKRSDGKQWRCSALSMPDKTVCEKHYIQAKKRAANSALRASLKKAKRKSMDDTDVYLESKKDEMDMLLVNTKAGQELMGSLKKSKEKASKNQFLHSQELVHGKNSSARSVQRYSEETPRDVSLNDEHRIKLVYKSPTSGSSSRSKSQKSLMGKAFVESSGRSTESSGEASGQTCHQCRRSDKGRVIWCLKCERKGYCTGCISKWYPDIPEEDIKKACPVCRGNCNCRLCLSGDNLIKVKIHEIAAKDKLQHLHRLLSLVLPLLKQIHKEQCLEIEVEKRVKGANVDVPRVTLSVEDMLFCDCCKMPIIDYHRHCVNCAFDLCLSCCRELRNMVQGDDETGPVEENLVNTVKAEATMSEHPEQHETATRQGSPSEHRIDFSNLFPGWILNSNGSIVCPPSECGGCGSESLVLQRVYKLNWLVKLQKLAEEIVNGCRVNEIEKSHSCLACLNDKPSEMNGLNDSVCKSSNISGSNDKLLYCPSSDDVNLDGCHHFQKHWARGEPIVVRNVFSSVLASSWDPMDIWRGIRETVDEKVRDGNRVVKAIDCLDWSEVDIELGQFLKGYSEGRIHENGWPQMLKLKDWPSSQALEEFLLYHRAEFISSLPLLEYVHSKWGILNLAAKLPLGSSRTNFEPKLFIAYGTYEELGRGDSVTNLHVNSDDVVHLLMHASEVKFQGWQRAKIEKIQRTFRAMDAKDNSGDGKASEATEGQTEKEKPDVVTSEPCKQNGNFAESNIKGMDSMDDHASHGMKPILGERTNTGMQRAGVRWEVFHRQDVSKLNEFLRIHWKEFRSLSALSNDTFVHPVYDQIVFLNEDHKRKLKEEFDIEPWTFEQHVGEAVFIPAGCPYQVRSLQSSVQLGLEFLSPESLQECVNLSQEIRCLPSDHEAKKYPLEVVVHYLVYILFPF